MSRRPSFRAKLPPGHALVTRAQEGALPLSLRVAMGRLRGLGLEMEAIRKPSNTFTMFCPWSDEFGEEVTDRLRELMDASFSSDRVWLRASQPPALSLIATGEPGTWLVVPLDPITDLMDRPPCLGQVRVSHPREVALIDWAALAQEMGAESASSSLITDMHPHPLVTLAHVDLPSGIMIFTQEAGYDPIMAAVAKASQPIHPFTDPAVVALAGDLVRVLDNGYWLLATGDLLDPAGEFVSSGDTPAIARMVAGISDNPDWVRDNLGMGQHNAVLAYFGQVMHMSALLRKEDARVPGFAEAVLAFCQQDDLDEDEFFDPPHREAFGFMMERLDEDGADLEDLRQAVTMVFALQQDDPEGDAPEI